MAHLAKHYIALDLPIRSSFDEVKASYRKLVLLYHSDKTQDKDEETQIAYAAKFLEIQAAYEILAEEDRKARGRQAHQATQQAFGALAEEIRKAREQHAKQPTQQAYSVEELQPNAAAPGYVACSSSSAHRSHSLDPDFYGSNPDAAGSYFPLPKEHNPFDPYGFADFARFPRTYQSQFPSQEPPRPPSA